MRINSSRLFPHPVLRNENKNFINASFNAEVSYRFDEKTYEFEIDISLNEENLLRLLKNKNVSILCHFECLKTKFRKVEPLILGKNKILLDSSYLEGKLDLIAVIIAEDDIEDYFSKNFDKEYKNSKFNIEKGEILGIADLPSLIIENKKENNANLATIFDVRMGNPGEKLMKIGLNEERIQIFLPPEEYKIRSAHKDNIYSRNVLNSMIVLPALVSVLNHLARIDASNTCGNRRWFRILLKKLKEKDYSIENGDLEDKDILTIAQELLGDLFSDSMDSLYYLQGSEKLSEEVSEE